MSEIKFSCPGCQQHIQADEGYAGLQINCPACNQALTVPFPALQAAAPVAVLATAASQSAGPSVASRPSSAAAGCPSCGTTLPRGAVICTRCGYNLATGVRTVAGRAVPMGRAMGPSGDVPWYKTAYPYIGTIVLILGGLYYGGRTNPAMMLAFVAILALYCVGVHILVVISAFKDSVGTGFLSLCLPFYAIYYVFKVNENPTLQALYSSAVIINIILRFLPFKIDQ